MKPRAALSVDVEFFSHLPAYRNASGTTDRTAVGSDGIEFFVNAFSEFGGTGTFFVVSEIADTHDKYIISRYSAILATHTTPVSTRVGRFPAGTAVSTKRNDRCQPRK